MFEKLRPLLNLVDEDIDVQLPDEILIVNW